MVVCINLVLGMYLSDSHVKFISKDNVIMNVKVFKDQPRKLRIVIGCILNVLVVNLVQLL